MPPIFTEGGAVLVEDGLKFDLSKTLDVCETLIDDCSVAFGRAIIRTIHPGYELRAHWPDPGRELFRKVWTEASKIYEAVDEPMVAVFPGLCLKIYPLGGATCRYVAATDTLVTRAGAGIEELDPAPLIKVYGEERGLNLFEVASPGMVDALEAIVSPELFFRKSEPVHVSTDMKTFGRFAYILFPHAAFGVGRGPIRVRCVRDA